MAKDTQFFDMFMNIIMTKISVSKLCRVVSYDAGAKRADIQPLDRKRNGSKRGMIQDAFILKHVTDDITVGAVVCVLFADCELDNVRGDQDFTPDSSRSHSVNDAIIVGVVDI